MLRITFPRVKSASCGGLPSVLPSLKPESVPTAIGYVCVPDRNELNINEPQVGPDVPYVLPMETIYLLLPAGRLLALSERWSERLVWVLEGIQGLSSFQFGFHSWSPSSLRAWYLGYIWEWQFSLICRRHIIPRGNMEFCVNYFPLVFRDI